MIVKGSNNIDGSKNAKNNRSIVFAAIMGFIFVVGIMLWGYFSLKDQCPTDRGTFGDMFGGVNALFSGLAFLGIIITILLQSKELSLQRQELKDTRDELQRSASAQEKSEIALNRQAENLKISAKLTALNTLVTYYADVEKQSSNNIMLLNQNNDAKSKRSNYLKQIEAILINKE